MKKVFSLIMAGILAFSSVSCVKEQFATFDPSKAQAPVLNDYTIGEDAIVADFTPGVFQQGFNEKMPVNHSFALVSLNGTTVSKTLTSSAKDGQLTLKTLNLIMAAITMGAEEGSNASMELKVRASMQDASKDNGRNGYVDSEGSIKLTMDLVIPEQVGSPYEQYTEACEWSLIGKMTAYGIDWDGDLNMWTTGSGDYVAAHVVLKAGDEVKFRKDQKWDENYGGDMVSVGTEFPVTAGGANIKIAEDGVYDLYLNLNDKTALVTEAYDPYPDFTGESTWTVIGKLPNYDIDWNGDIPMVSDGTSHVAFGVSLGAEDEFKFRKDKSWDVNLGGAFGGLDTDFPVSQGGDNIKVGAEGVYDLFVNPDASTAKVTAACGLKISAVIKAGGDEPEKPQVWSLIGTLSGSNWDADTDMTNTEGDIWIARNVALIDTDEFKIRADHDWNENYGGPEENAQSTIDPANPYGVFKPTLGEAFEAGDKNIAVGVAGNYDITFDYAKKTILITAHTSGYSLIGEINGDSWTKDIVMTEKDGVWTSPVVNITGGFKIRYDFSWEDENCYGAAADDFVAEVGTPFTATQPGKDIKLAAAGDYKVQFTPATKEVLISAVEFPEHLYMIGEAIGGWDWNADYIVDMTPVINNQWGGDAAGQFYAIRWLPADKGFKFCAKKAWDGDFCGLTTNDGFTESGGNCTVAQDGIYMIHVDMKNGKLHVEPARVYGIGDCFGSWDEGVAANLFAADGKKLKITVPTNASLRAYVASEISTSSWWTREFTIIDGKIAYRTGDELAWPSVSKDQVVTFDFNAGTGTISGEAQEVTYSLIGFHAAANWDKNVDMEAVTGHAGWTVAKNIAAKDGNIDFKFRKGGSWVPQIGAANSNPKTTGVKIRLALKSESSQNDPANIHLTGTGTYDVYLNETDLICVILTAGTAFAVPSEWEAEGEVEHTWGIIGEAVGGWTTDVDLTADGDYFSAKNVAFTANVGFKFRADHGWSLQRTHPGVVPVGEWFTLEDGNGENNDMKLAAAGTYDVYLAKDLSKAIIVTAGTSL